MVKKGKLDKQTIELIQEDDEKETVNYQLNVNYYSISPKSNIEFDCVQDLIDERLSVLAALSEIKEDFNSVKGNPNFYMSIKHRLSQAKCQYNENFFKVLCSPWDPFNFEQINARKRDHSSHFLLRLYYCQTESFRKWFISKETELLRLRLMDENNRYHLETFIRENRLNFEQVQSHDFTRFQFVEKVDFEHSHFLSNKIYKVPFDQALELVRRRKVYIHKGYAYIYLSDMISVICQLFHQELNGCLINLNSVLPHLGENNRLLPLLHSLHLKHFPVTLFKVESKSDSMVVKPEAINCLSKQLFPPCMERIHHYLRANHHIRHFSRLYYGQFLKNIGLSLENAITFFKQEFTQKMSEQRFDRHYKPNIHYNYFKHGNMINRSAYSCLKIINSHPPGPLDVHGCPFRHYDKKHLRKMLDEHEIRQDGQKRILLQVSNKCYRKACEEYFKLKYPTHSLPEEGIYHPNQFFNESRKASQLNSDESKSS